jgi:hypothetical protein
MWWMLRAAENAEAWVIRNCGDPEMNRDVLADTIAYAATMRCYATTGGRSLLAAEED